MPDTTLPLDDAVATAATGDIWLFRGRSLADVAIRTLTRERPAGWDGYDRRVDREMLEAVGPGPAERPHVFVCGPTGFVEQAADALVAVGHQPDAIHAERFGPTGG